MSEHSLILQVRDLSTTLIIDKNRYVAVNQVSFDLFKGKTMAIVGESGSGKTLTALSILRILPQPPAIPPKGQILYKGKNLLSLSENEMRLIRGKNISMIFQDPMSSLNPVLSIGFQLNEVVELHLGISGDKAKTLIKNSLRDVGLTDSEKIMNSYPHQLSGGMKQRAMIAMALLCEPDILIADEPTTALDVTIQAQILDLLVSLQKKKGMAILLITHDLGVVAQIADDVTVMYASQVVERGDIFQIFDAPSHPYTQGLFKSRPQKKESQKELTPIQGAVPHLGHFPSGCHFHPRCPFVMEICKKGEVPNFIINERDMHLAKCWLHKGKSICPKDF